MTTMTLLDYEAQLLRWRREAEYEAAKEQRGKGKNKNVEGLVRKGKTHKDRSSGAQARNEENKFTRAEWGRTGGPFPYHTCNGKRNRFDRGHVVR